MTTVADLYASVLGRDVSQIDPEGLAYWTQMFGPEVDDIEAGTFKSVANVTEPSRVAAVANLPVNRADLNPNYFDTAQTAPTAAPAPFDPFKSNISPSALQALQRLDLSVPKYETYTTGVGEGEVTLQRPVAYLPSGYGEIAGDDTVAGFYGPSEVVNGVTVRPYYDAQGNLEKYVGGATQNLSDSVRLSAEWDPTGKAAPVQWNTDNGLFNSGITFDDAVRTAIMVAAATAGGTPEAGAAEAGGSEAVSGIDLGGVGASPNTWMGGGTYGTVPAAISSTVPAGFEGAASDAAFNQALANSGASAASALTAAEVIKALPLVSTVASLVGGGGNAGGGPTGPTTTQFPIVPVPDTWKPPTYPGNNVGTGGLGGGIVGGAGGGAGGGSFGGLDLNKIFTDQNLLTGTQWQGLPNQRNLTFNDIFAAGQQSTPMGTPVNLNNIVSAILGQNATSQKSA